MPTTSPARAQPAAGVPQETGAASPPAPRHRVTPNLFGISFGLAGLAECWNTAAAQSGVPAWVGDAVTVLAAAVWLVTACAWISNVIAGGRVRTELADPVFGPFTALFAIVPMILGAVLAAHNRTAGVTVFAVALVATVLLGGLLLAQWILSDTSLAQWHPGYFLPTVAGGFVAALCCAELGFHHLAELMFGYGTVSWLALGSILLQRLFTQPQLPVPLRPTMAIEMAPPVVAGAAWFAINGGRVDGVALGLAGYAVLMGLVQLRLIPVYRQVPFGAGWWAFSFSYAAVFLAGLRWLDAEHVHDQRAWTWVLLAVVSAAMGALALRTVDALAHGRFLPPAGPAPAPAAAAHGS